MMRFLLFPPEPQGPKKKVNSAYRFSFLLHATHASLSLPLFYYLCFCHHLR